MYMYIYKGWSFFLIFFDPPSPSYVQHLQYWFYFAYSRFLGILRDLISRNQRGSLGILGNLISGDLWMISGDLRRSLGICGDIRNRLKRKNTKKNLKMTFVTTNLNKEIITLCLNSLLCVCKILHVNLNMIQRNVFKVYESDDQI